MFRQLLKPRYLVGASAAIVGTAAVAGQVACYYDPGTKRSMQFWGEVFPIFMHYRFYQLLNRDLKIMDDVTAETKYNELHDLYTERVKDLTYRLRGFYLKHAQLMSVQDDFVPPAYLKWMKDTQDNVPACFEGTGAREYVRGKLKEELGLDFDEVFSEWDDVPLGTASIGQVHKATLKSNGKTVAVKLLIPGMEETFRSDIRTIKTFCEMAMPQHVPAFDEIEKQFCSEFDYRKEGENLELIRNAITPKWGKHFEVPKPYLNLCSKHVLIMDYLEGIKLVDGIRKEFKKIAKLTGRSAEELEAEFKEKIKNGTFHFRTLEENQVERRKIQWYMTLNDCIFTPNLLKLAYNYSPLSFFTGPMKCEWSELPMDLGNVIEKLCLVHGSQIFEHGSFNGDPHPGNILLLKDGCMGLIDYGQVKHMTTEERIKLAKLTLAHSRMDKDEVVRIHFDELGVVTKYRNADVAYRMSAFYNDRDTFDVCQGMNMVDFLDYLEAQDPVVKLADPYLFACRVSLMMRGLGKAFGLQLRMSKMWESEARELLKQNNIEY